MKRIKRFSFVMIMLIVMPVFVNAAGNFEYSNGHNYAIEYIKKGNFRTTYERYIKITDRSHYVDKNEYELTKDNNGRSYLFDGVEFWTNTSGSTDHYYVSYNGSTQKATGSSSKYNVKDVEYVKENVKVRGRGTYNNPWTFDPMYEVKVITDGRYGHIVEPTGESYSKTVFASRGEDVVMQVEKKAGTGYKYLTNNCGATYSNGFLTISNIKRNITCKVIFGTGKFKVTLTGATPNKIVSNFRDNFYKYNDSMNLRDIITKVTPPTREGYMFAGYKYNGVPVVNPDGSLNRAAVNIISEDVTLEPDMKELIFNARPIAKTFSTSAQTDNVTPASNGSGSYKYTKVSGASDITVSPSGVITIPASKATGTYTIVIRATDTVSNAKKDATYTIKIGCNTTLTLTSGSSITTAGAKVTYGGQTWIVTSADSNKINLVLSGVSGKGKYSGAISNTKSLLDANAITKDALAAGCIVNNGSSSNSKLNAPSSEYWLSSGKVYVPSKVNTYSFSKTKYSRGYLSAQSGTTIPNAKELYTSKSGPTTLYNAGATATVTGDPNKITYINTSYTTTAYKYYSKSWVYFKPSKSCGTASSSKLPMYKKQEGALNNSELTGCINNNDLKEYVFKLCDTSTGNHGKTFKITAKSSTEYTVTDIDGTTTTHKYSDGLYYNFAGARTSEHESSNIRTYDFSLTGSSESHCDTRTEYKGVDTIRDIHYRPYISVKR